MKKNASVLLPLALNQAFTYSCLEGLKIGTFVKVNFRKKNVIGVVLGYADTEEIEQNKIKPVEEVLAIPPLSEETLEFINRVAKYNILPLGMVLKMVIGQYPAKSEKLLNNPDKHELIFQDIHLSSEQAKAAEDIDLSSHAVHVIDGVTGSGKTEVYLKLAQRALMAGGQVLILTPEILLTTQLESRFLEKIGSLGSWHSSILPSKKAKIWYGSRLGDAKLIVGARSALFLPFCNLKLIIVDEEHDSSFKQEEGNVYNGRDMAVLRGHIEKIPVILSSATPSIETVKNMREGLYKSHILKARHGGVQMPEARILDMNSFMRSERAREFAAAKEEKNQNKISDSKDRANKDEASSLKNKIKAEKPKLIGRAILHSYSEEKIRETMGKGKQSLVFINRRGYAPIAYCTYCATKQQCSHCHACLVYHKAAGVMQCHHCGYSTQKISQCGECLEDGGLVLYGCGVEQVHEHFAKTFPEARLAIITSETMSSAKEAKKVLAKIYNREIDIIIGTQIIAKGLNFPDLHLVVALDANPSYISADIRSMEKTYQLLYQVIGRAGRSDMRGEVILQTIDKDDPLVNCIANYDKDKFVELELKNRQDAFVPPYSRMISLVCKDYKEERVLEAVEELRKTMPSNIEDIHIFGPSPCPMKVLRGYHRYRFLIKAKRSLDLQGVVSKWLANTNIASSVKIKVDVDPQNFM